MVETDVNDRVKVTHRYHGIMTRPPTSFFSFKCLSPRYLEALKEKTAGSLLRYQTGPKWVTFALAKSGDPAVFFSPRFAIYLLPVLFRSPNSGYADQYNIPVARIRHKYT